MTTLSHSADARQGWNIFVKGGYIDDCANDEQRQGFSDAWREAEGMAPRVTAVNWNSGPDMVIGFPDLTTDEIDAILTQTPVFEAQADQSDYNWGWTAWGLGLISDYLEGPALQGWQDAADAFAEEVATERRMFGQLVNGY